MTESKGKAAACGGESDRPVSAIDDYRASHTAPGKGESYDLVAHEGRHRSLIWAWEQRVLASVIERRLAGRAVQSLDFACGTGRIVGFLENHVAHATGVDISESMLSVARRKLSRAELHLADVTQENILADRRFDLITAFRFFLNAQQELREQAIVVLAEHLADDGYLVFNNHLPRGCLMHMVLWAYSKATGRSEPRVWSVAEVDRLVEGVGLRIVERHAWGLLPATDNHLPLPRAILGPLENGISKAGVFRPFAQNVIFVCTRAR